MRRIFAVSGLAVVCSFAAAPRAVASPHEVSSSRAFVKIMAPNPVKYDAFGIEMLEADGLGARTWIANWAAPRVIPRGAADPLDPEFQNRGDTNFTILGNGVATVAGGALREAISDPTRAKQWQNIEVTFYAMRMSDTDTSPGAGFVVDVRADDPHADPAKSCGGASYSMAMFYDGRAEFRKEASQHLHSTVNPSAMIWPSTGSVPRNKWVGVKAIVKDVPLGVSLELLRDLTDGEDGGDWKPVLSYIDQGAWSVGAGGPVCGAPADHVIRGPHAAVLLGGDQATVKYKKLSVREIKP